MIRYVGALLVTNYLHIYYDQMMINLHLCIEILQVRTMCENFNPFICNINSFNPVDYVRCGNIFYLKN